MAMAPANKAASFAPIGALYLHSIPCTFCPIPSHYTPASILAPKSASKRKHFTAGIGGVAPQRPVQSQENLHQHPIDHLTSVQFSVAIDTYQHGKRIGAWTVRDSMGNVTTVEYAHGEH